MNNGRTVGQNWFCGLSLHFWKAKRSIRPCKNLQSRSRTHNTVSVYCLQATHDEVDDDETAKNGRGKNPLIIIRKRKKEVAAIGEKNHVEGGQAVGCEPKKASMI